MKRWCAVCCTQHLSGPVCPGELRATGPERFGRRIQARSADRAEIYGVLIAEAGALWRARVLTYPNMLWSVPGGKGTVKFVGDSPQEAEKKAVAFIEQSCKAHGYPVIERVAQAESATVPEEAADRERPRGAKDARHLRFFEVQFGAEKPATRAVTTDLSQCGLFVATDQPLAAGSTIHLRLELEEFTIPLLGQVAWARRREEQGRPAGMGVHLRNPPALYVRFVRELEKQGAAAGEAPAAEGV